MPDTLKRSYRLSPDAVALLDNLRRRTGLKAPSILEIAIREFAGSDVAKRLEVTRTPAAEGDVKPEVPHE